MGHSKRYAFLTLLALSAVSCNKQDQNTIVSQKYVHKYGYAVSQGEWLEKNYPGQVVTHLADGSTITATYENGMLHGPTTKTYPSSQTVKEYSLYNEGLLVKEITYDPSGMPVAEKTQVSPTRTSLTLWYEGGAPLLIEEYVGKQLLEGQYFSQNHEVEYRITQGNGTRTERSSTGTLLSRADYQDGWMTQQETFYPSGTPASVSHFIQGVLNGEKRVFAETGEPVSAENYVDGQLHGKAIYYDHGNKRQETQYRFGEKQGLERHFISGDILSQEINWENNLKHGPATFYIDQEPQVQWFYEGSQVSKRKYDELTELDALLFRGPSA